MDYHVRLVEDAALPEGVAWTFARQGGQTYLFVKRSAVGHGECDALTRAWECWQSMEAEPARQRVRVRSEVGNVRNLTAVLLAAYGVPAMKATSAVL